MVGSSRRYSWGFGYSAGLHFAWFLPLAISERSAASVRAVSEPKQLRGVHRVDATANAVGRTEAGQVPDFMVDSSGGDGGVGGRHRIARWIGFSRRGDPAGTDGRLPVETVRARPSGG